MNYKPIILIIVSSLLFLPISFAINLPSSNVGQITVPSLNSSNLPISSYLLYSMLIALAVIFVVAAALRMTNLKSGAYMIGIILGAIVFFFLYSNPNLANTLGNLFVVYALVILVLAGLIALARRRTNPLAILIGLIVLFILFYLILLNNKGLQSFLNSAFHINTTNFMSMFLPYIIGIILIYLFYRIFYKRFGEHILGTIIILTTALLFFVPGMIFFWWVLVILLFVAGLIAFFYWLHKRYPPGPHPGPIPNPQNPNPKKGEKKQIIPSKPIIVPCCSRKHPNKHTFLWKGGQYGSNGGFANKQEIEEYKKNNPPPSGPLPLIEEFEEPKRNKRKDSDKDKKG